MGHCTADAFVESIERLGRYEGTEQDQENVLPYFFEPMLIFNVWGRLDDDAKGYIAVVVIRYLDEVTKCKENGTWKNADTEIRYDLQRFIKYFSRR